MQITRRKFINAACASAFIVAGGGLTATFGQKDSPDDLFPVPPEAYSESLFSMTASQLQDYVGSRFTATIEGLRPVTLVLEEVNTVERMANAIRGTYGECFSLVFTGAERRPVQQGTYNITTQGLDPFTALVVPVDRSRLRYEIIINHVTR